MKTLVTGGTGFIGASLVGNLVRKGYDVRTFDNNFRGNIDKLGEYASQVELVEGDIRDPSAVADAVKGVETVFHLAFINGTRHFYENPDLVLEVGLKGTLNVMDACIEHGVERYVYASSAEVYQTPTHFPTSESERLIIPDPRNPRYSYGGAKAIGEVLALHYAMRTKMESVIFRPHNVYGPNMGIEHVIPQLSLKLSDILAKSDQKDSITLPIQGSGEETRAFCFVEDAAEGIELVGRNGEPGSIYHVGTQDEVSIKDLVGVIAEYMGVSVTTEPSSPPSGETSRRCPDISAARGLGYQPKVSLAEGVAKTCEWYMK